MEAAQNRAEAAFAEISQRCSWLGDRYPIDTERDVALLSKDPGQCLVYRFLVLLRARHLYPGALEDDGEESGFLFEELSKFGIGAYIGTEYDHQVRFGVSGGSRGDGLPGELAAAVQELSGRMFEKIGEVPSSGQGDYRADAIAWKPFGDKRPGQLAIVCQATISEEDWQSKEPPGRWTDRQPPESRLIRFLATPLTAVAFPETLSLTPNETLLGLSLSSVPFDRLRLLSVLHDVLLPEDLCGRIQLWGDDLMERIPR